MVKFASLIVATRHGFDRVLVKGHLPLASVDELERFVDDVLKVRRADFAQTIAPQKLLPYATVTFTPTDILGFLGRKCDRRFDGDL